MLIKLDDGRLKDVAVSEVTPENYIVPEGEECTWHVVQEIVQFSPTTGKRLSVPRVQKYDDKIWRNIMERHLKLQGYKVLILHDPTNDIKDRNEKTQKMKAAMSAKASMMTKEQQEREIEERVEKALTKKLAELSNKNSKGKKDVNDRNSKG